MWKINVKMNVSLSRSSLTNPVSTFGVKIIFDPFTIPFSVSVPSCSSLFFFVFRHHAKKQRERERDCILVAIKNLKCWFFWAKTITTTTTTMRVEKYVYFLIRVENHMRTAIKCSSLFSYTIKVCTWFHFLPSHANCCLFYVRKTRDGTHIVLKSEAQKR